MVKIYRDEKNFQVIIEGVSPEYASLLDKSISNGRVTITSKSKKKVIFDALWENIADINGNTFATQSDLVNYLNTVFDDVQLIKEPHLLNFNLLPNLP